MIPIEDLTDVTLAIQYTDKDDEGDEDDEDDKDDEEDLTVVNLVSDDTYWKICSLEISSSYESYQVMKVIKWWKLSSDESYLVMKFILWWKLSSDESYLVMKVI